MLNTVTCLIFSKISSYNCFFYFFLIHSPAIYFSFAINIMLCSIAWALFQMHTLWWLICFHRFLRAKEPWCCSSAQNVCVFCPTPDGLKINPVWSCAFHWSCFSYITKPSPVFPVARERVPLWPQFQQRFCLPYQYIWICGSLSLILIFSSSLWCLSLVSCSVNNTTSITKSDA